MTGGVCGERGGYEVNGAWGVVFFLSFSFWYECGCGCQCVSMRKDGCVFVFYVQFVNLGLLILYIPFFVCRYQRYGWGGGLGWVGYICLRLRLRNTLW